MIISPQGPLLGASAEPLERDYFLRDEDNEEHLGTRTDNLLEDILMSHMMRSHRGSGNSDFDCNMFCKKVEEPQSLLTVHPQLPFTIESY